MPQYKHPCPHCGNFIMRDVAVCPYCATPDPFSPGRCPTCRAVIEDPKWAACPKCGQSLVAPPPAEVSTSHAPSVSAAPAVSTPAAAAPLASAPAVARLAEPEAAAAAPRRASATASPHQPTCAICGSPLAVGARFCAVCGTLVS